MDHTTNTNVKVHICDSICACMCAMYTRQHNNSKKAGRIWMEFSTQIDYEVGYRLLLITKFAEL